MNTIRLQNTEDPASILAAFQQALETTVTPATIQAALTDPAKAHTVQRILLPSGESPLGAVTLTALQAKPSQMQIAASLMHGHRSDHAPRNLAVVQDMVHQGRLALELTCPGRREFATFGYESTVDFYGAQIRTPVEDLRQMEQLRIFLRW